MKDIYMDAMIILRAMYERGVVGPGGADFWGSELMSLTGLSEAQVDSADTFLLESRYLEGTNGLSGSRWLTPSGVRLYREEQRNRIPLSLDAEKLARHMAKKSADGKNDILRSHTLIRELLMDETQYLSACQELADYGLLTDKFAIQEKSFVGVEFTAKGRNAVRDNFKVTTPMSSNQHIGPIFHGPVIDSNIQAVANAAASTIQQAINQGNQGELRNEIIDLIERVVELAKPDLDANQISAYELAKEQLKAEIEKPSPEPKSIQRLIGVLAFMDDLDGAIELGKKALILAARVGPLIITLQQAMVQLLQ